MRRFLILFFHSFQLIVILGIELMIILEVITAVFLQKIFTNGLHEIFIWSHLFKCSLNSLDSQQFSMLLTKLKELS